MKTIISYIRKYFYESDKRLLLFTTILTGILIFANYYFRIDDQLHDNPSFMTRFAGRYIIFLIAFGLPYLFYSLVSKQELLQQPPFVFLVLLAPAIFSLKAGLVLNIKISANEAVNDYWNHIIYWPVLLLLVLMLVFICWKIFDRAQPFYGTVRRNLDWKPYWIMLLIMIPLIAAASTQPDFLEVYPKLKLIFDETVQLQLTSFHKLLFELSYGSDFIGIELFFRGFLVLAFLKWAGKDAVIPMACFYCTIHFGKPLGECISSYFGGLLLGIVVQNTRSMWGGLMVHLGIAWLMELGGYIGALVK